MYKCMYSVQHYRAHLHLNALSVCSSIGTYIYLRRMYENDSIK